MLPDVIVIGGGVVGCAAAFFLAERGAQVTLLERDTTGAHASGAAAGMLAPIAESEDEGPFFDLCLRGLEQLAAVVPRLRERTGIDPLYSPCGVLRVALHEEESEALRSRAARLAHHGLRWLNAEEARSLEPGLTPEARGAIHSPREAHVSSPGLVRAYAAAAAAAGARLVEGAEVTGLTRSGGRVTGVRTAAGEMAAGAVVLAAGAWSGPLAREGGLRLPVEPVRGQILALDNLPGGPERIVWGGGAYLVPRRDGSVTVGATVERVGFDARVTAAGAASLLAAAPRLLPLLADATFRRAWAGLRPAAPDRLPVLGPAADVPGLFLATGHFRNGILLSAVTGELLADWILAGRAPWPQNPFAVERFQPPGA